MVTGLEREGVGKRKFPVVEAVSEANAETAWCQSAGEAESVNTPIDSAHKDNFY
ncbi:hypothetical protein L0Y40_00990 [Candidatus Wolfebacteria bacterium]|nr:hypothetical protein [Candidatus Wolfebacteria bacterium]